MMRRLALGLAVALAACGGKIEEVSPGATTGTTPPPTATGTSVPPSPGAPPEPTPVPPPKDPAPVSNRVFSAHALPGGLDHLMILAADHGADSCVRIHLTRPFSGGPSAPFPNVITPAEWGVRDISRSPGAKRCGPGRQPPAAEEAEDAKGTITFTPAPGSVYPCSLDVHVVALFDDKPTVEQLDGDKIAVAGCQ